jgi:ketosteroid isomerase-like protein
MTIASDLLQRHFQTLVEDNAQWQKLIADDLVWELPYAPAIGHPARLSGRAKVVRHLTWFLEAVENFRFYDLKVYAFGEAAVAEVGGVYQTYGPYLSPGLCAVPPCGGHKNAFLREYFDPVRAAKALDTPILVLNPDFQTARDPVGHETFRMAISCQGINGRKTPTAPGSLRIIISGRSLCWL